MLKHEASFLGTYRELHKPVRMFSAASVISGLVSCLGALPRKCESPRSQSELHCQPRTANTAHPWLFWSFSEEASDQAAVLDDILPG